MTDEQRKEPKNRKLIVNAYLKKGNLDKAEQEARALHSQDPNDLAAARTLADIWSWNKKFDLSLNLFEALKKNPLYVNPPDLPPVPLRIAEVTLWSAAGRTDVSAKAAKLFEALLSEKEKFNQPDLWPGFVDAVSGQTAADTSASQQRMIVQIAKEPSVLDGKAGDPNRPQDSAQRVRNLALLTRLASVLTRQGKVQADKEQKAELIALATPLIERAVAMAPEVRPPDGASSEVTKTVVDVKRELAGVLAASDRPKEALALYKDIHPRVSEDNAKLADIHSHPILKEWPEALVAAKAYASENPTDLPGQMRVANILSWSEDYSQSLEEFRKLKVQFPDVPEIPVRIAEVTLWSQNFREAFAEFAKLLTQPKLDPPGADPTGQPNLTARMLAGFTDAASGLLYKEKKFTPKEVETIREVRQKAQYAPLNPHEIGRLAYVLYMAGGGKEAGSNPLTDDARNLGRQAVTQALALTKDPNDPETAKVRKELAGVLAAMQEFESALQLYADLPLTDPKDKLELASLYMAAGGRVEAKKAEYFKKAEELLVNYVGEVRDDPAGWKRLADLHSYNGEYAKSLNLLKQLKEKYPNDPDIPVRIAEVTLWSNEPDQALALFTAPLVADVNQPQWWAGFIDAAARATAPFTPDQRRIANLIYNATNVRASAKYKADWTEVGRTARLARVLAKLARPADASREFAEALKLYQANKLPADRRELAGLLTASDRVKDGLELYKNERVADDDRETLIWMYGVDGQFAAAVEEAKTLANSQPGEKTRLLLANTLSWAGENAQALPILTDLRKANPNDPALLVRLAEVTLYAGNTPDALALFTEALGKPIDNPKVLLAARKGFVDAAAAVDAITPAQTLLAVGIADAPGILEAADKTDVPFLSRLSWVLIRDGRTGRADPVLNRARDLGPTDPKVRKELAGVLAAAGHGQSALDLFGKPDPNDPEDRHRLANIYVAMNQWGKAIKEAKEYEKLSGGSLKAERLLADLYSWNGDFDAALVAFAELRKKLPDDKTLPVRQAETTLWANRPNEALAQFTHILEKDPDQKAAVLGFIASAFQADIPLPDDSLKVAFRVKKDTADQSADAVLIGRLGYAFYRTRTHGLAAATAGNDLLNRAVNVVPPPAWNTRDRTELGGILTVSGRPDEAEKMWAGLKFNPVDRLRLAQVYESVKDYPHAIDVARELLQRVPRDRKAKFLLANVYSYDRKYQAALDLFNELKETNARENVGEDFDLNMRIAETTLWSGNPERALGLYEAELKREEAKKDREPLRPKLIRGLIEAAAGTDRLTPDQAALVKRLFNEEQITRSIGEAGYQVRLGRALELANMPDEAREVLDAVAKLTPEEPRVRKDVAAVLAAAGRPDDAAKLLAGLRLDPPDYAQFIYLAAGRKAWDAAEEWAKRYQAAYPDDLQAKRLRADVYSWWGEGHFDEAIKLFKELEAEGYKDPDPKGVPVAVRIAETTLWSGRATEAMDLFIALLDKNADDPAVRDGFLAAVAGYPDADLPPEARKRAASVLAKLITTKWTDPAKLARVAQVYVKLKRDEDAKRLLTQALKLPLPDAAARRELAGALAAAKMAKEGLKLYPDGPASPADRELVADLYAAAENWGPALELLEDLHKKEPDNDAITLRLARVYAGKGDYKQAAELNRELLKKRPKDVALAVETGQIELAAERYNDALSLFAGLLADHFNRADVRKGFVDAAAAADNVTAADAALAVRIANDPATLKGDKIQYLARLAWVLIDEGLPGPVNALLDRAEALAKSSATTLADRRELAGVLAAANRGERALALFGGEELRPQDHYALANIHASVKQFRKAIDECRKYLEKFPNDPKAEKLLADLHSWNRDFDEALVEFDKLKAKYPDNKDIPIRFAETTLWAKRPDEALDLFTALLAADPNQPKAVPGFIGSGVEADALTTEAVAVADRLRAALPTAPEQFDPRAAVGGGAAAGWSALAESDPLRLARLGYVFRQARQEKVADGLFDTAVAAIPVTAAQRKVRGASAADAATADAKLRSETAAMLDIAGRKADAAMLRAGLPFDAANLYATAQVYASVGGFKAAIVELRTILGKEPTNRAARRLLADCLTWDRQFQEGLAMLRALLSESPGDPDLPARIAQTLVWDNKPEQAVAAYRRELVKDPTQPKLVRGLIEAAAALGALSKPDAELVATSYKTVPIIQQITEPVFVAQLGRALQLAGLAEEAERALDRAYANPPRSAKGRADLAAVLADAGRADAALQILETIPPDPNNYVRLTGAFAARKDWAAAERAARAFRAAFPADPTATRQLADVLSWWGGEHRQEALALFAELVAANPIDADNRLRQAEVKQWTGDNAGAVPGFVASVGNRAAAAVVGVAAAPGWWGFDAPIPSDAAARSAAGFAAAAAGVEGLSSSAVDLASRLIAMPAVQTDPMMYGRLTTVLYRAGRPLPSGAVARFIASAGRLAAESPDQRREVAGLLSSLNRPQLGLDLYAKVEPTPADRQLLAGLYLAAGNTEAAYKEALAVLNSDPTSVAAQQLMADVLAKQGDFKSARDRYENLLKDRPRDIRLLMSLARLDMSMKRWEAAVARLATVLEIDFEAAQAKAEFVNAAAAAKKITEDQAAVATKIAEDPDTMEEDAVRLARLSWVLIREKAPGPIKEMLDQAYALNPTTPADRKEVAGVLAAAGRGEDALKMFGTEPPESAEDHFLLANIFATRKDFAPALTHCKEYLRLRPDDPDDFKGHRLLADLLSYARFFDQALVEFDKLKAKLPDDKSIPVRIAETILWDDRAADALELFTRILDADPNQTKAVAGFAAAAFGLAEVPPESMDVAEKVLAVMQAKWVGFGVGAGGLAGGWAVGKPEDPLVLARLGYVFHKADRDDLADPLLVRAALLVPRGEAEARVRWELGGILDVADWPKLADSVWAGLKVPAEPEDRYQLALVYAAVRDFQSAIDICRNVLTYAPKFRKGERLLADCLTWDEQYAEGLALLEKLLRETPDDPDLPTRIAQTLVWAGRPPEALDRYKAELLKHWGVPKLVRGMVEAAAAMNAIPDEDAKLIARAYKEFKDTPVLRRVANPIFIARLGRVLQLVGLPDDANRELDLAEKATPRGVRDRQELASVLADAGRTEAALKLFDGLPPALADYRRLAYLNAVRQNWPAAVKSARANVEANPGDPAALRTLADILSWWGGEHRKEALDIFAKLVALDPADPGLRLRVAEVRQWDGDNAGVIPAFTAILAGRGAAALVGGVAAPVWDATVSPAPLPGDIVARAALGFAAAVGGVDPPPRVAADLAGALTRDWPSGTIDPLSAARLAAALKRARLPVPAGVVERFVLAAPELAKKGPGDRREVAGLLGTFDQPQAGLDLYRGETPTREDIPLLAGLFLAAKNFPAAEQQARNLLQIIPGDPTAERLLADIQAAQGKYDAAAKTYERLVGNDPRNVKLLVGLGRLYQAANLPDKAAGRLLAALDLNYDEPDARIEFINSLAGLPAGRLTDAEMAFAIRVAEDPDTLKSDSAVYLTRLAYVLLREKAPGPVNALLDRAIALDPKEQADRKELAGVLAFADRGAEAFKVFGEVRPDHPEDRITLANILSALGDFPAAIREVQAYLVVKPIDPEAEKLLANLRSYNGEFDEALAGFESLLAKNPTDKLLPIRIAETTLWGGRSAEALVRFVRILTADINQPQAIAGFVNAAFQTAPVPADALAMAEKVRARLTAGWVGGGTPAGAVGGVLAVGRYDDPLLLAKLGYVFSKADRPADADPLFARAALEATGDDGRVRWELGGVFDAAGRQAQAQAAWAGLRYQPAVAFRLAQLFASVRDFPRAVAEARKAFDAEPNNRRYRRLLADCLTWNRDWDAGLVYLRELQQAAPDDPDLTARIAETLTWSGKPADSLLTYSDALRRYWGRPKLVRGFVEAIAGLPADARPTAGDLDLLNRILREYPALAQSTDAVFAARFARALQAAGRVEDATKVFDRVLATDLSDARTRRLLAPLLAAGGRIEDAERMFVGLTPEPDDFLQLSYLFVARKNWVEAEKFARKYQAAFPADPKAAQLVADVLSWWGGKDRHAESLKLFAELLKANPGDKGLLLRAAEVKLWAGNFVRAAEEFLALLKAGGLTDPEKLRARDGLLAAAAGALASPAALTLPIEYADLAEQVARGLPPAAVDADPVRAARLAVILERANRPTAVPGLIARAVAVPPSKLAVEVRRDLAGLLGALKRFDDAVALLKSLPELTLEDRFALAGLYSGAEKFADAEREARAAIESAPNDPRAVRLLANVLSWKHDYTDAIKVYERLIKENPEDQELKKSLAQVLLYAGKYVESADRFLPLLEADPGQIALATDFVAAVANVNSPKPEVLALAAKVAKTPAARTATDPMFLTNMAWVLRRATDRAEGEKYLEMALGIVRATMDSAAKKNLAGVLETYGGKWKKDAIGLFRGLDLTADDRLRLAGLYAAESYDDKTSYDPTIAECREILKADPGNLKAKRLLADALSWNAVRTETPPKVAAVQFKESLALFRELAAVGFADKSAENFVPNDIRIAEATLWSKAYDDALGLYRTILKGRFEQPIAEQTLSVWQGYIDAASSAQEPTDEDRKIIRKISDRLIDDPKTSVARLSRMAWVLRETDPARTKLLLDIAVERVRKEPTPAEFRKEVAGVLATVGRYKEALSMYDGLELTYDDRLRIAEIFVAQNDFGAAEVRLRGMLRDDPDNRPTRLLLADVLTWDRKYPEAERMLTEMRAAAPTDAGVLSRLATVYVYDNRAERAVALLTPPLTENLEQRDLWMPYLDAVGSSTNLPASTRALMDRVVARVQEDKGLKDTTDALRLIGGALARSGRAERAIVVLRQAVNARPNDHKLRLRYAEVLSLAGRFAEAEEQNAIVIRQSQQQQRVRPAPPPAAAPTDAGANRGGRSPGTTVARPR